MPLLTCYCGPYFDQDATYTYCNSGAFSTSVNYFTNQMSGEAKVTDEQILKQNQGSTKIPWVKVDAMENVSPIKHTETHKLHPSLISSSCKE